MRKCEIYPTVRQAPHDNMVHAISVLDKRGKNTDTQSEYVIHVPFPCQQRLRDRTSLFRYMYIACRVNVPIDFRAAKATGMSVTPYPSVAVTLLK